MCRSIKTLRRKDGPVDPGEIRAAALQYVRKVSGYREPSRANAPAVHAAVDEIAQASERLLTSLAPRSPGIAAKDCRGCIIAEVR